MSRFLLYTLTVIALLAAGLLGYGVVRALLDEPAAVSRSGGSFGVAAIGGPFTLVDGDGRTRTLEDFRGKLMLVYFGFTYCPDVCPTELQTMSRAIDLLGPQGEEVTPILITVDPERDTPEVIKSYVANFHPRMVGLTGTPEQVAEAAKAWRVYYRKAEVSGSTDYLMDHSSYVYLMGRDGQFLTHFRADTKPDEMAAAIRKLL